MGYNRLITIDGKISDPKLRNRIKSVVPRSPADRAGIKEGQYLLEVDGTPLKDIIDYRYLTSEEKFTLKLSEKDEDGNSMEFSVDIEKDTYEDLGLEFMSGLIDHACSCSNKCIFCFIDQLPPGMRESLYFKDDDSRLSFLQGNFVTLTNMTDSDIERIIKYRISPINISVHTTNPELRIRMLRNRNAGKIMERMKLLADNRIEMNAQIVLVPGYNDGDELISTLKDLKDMWPAVMGTAVVPLGLTGHRENLMELTPFNAESAKKTIETVEKLGQEFLKDTGTYFARCADEFYVMAGMDVPSEEYYEGYSQIEDGIGMIRLFRESTDDTLEDLNEGPGEFTFVTGTSAFSEINDFAGKVRIKNPDIKTDCVRIKNRFFGESITVAGLLTGKDVLSELKEHGVYKNLVMPRNMFRAGEDIMLDGIRIGDIESALGTHVLVVDYTGEDMIDRMNGRMKG